MPLHFCHSPLKVALAVATKLISPKNPASKPIKSLTKNKIKVTPNKTDIGNEIGRCTIKRQITRGSKINSYKGAILKEPNNNKGLTPMKEWSILCDHVRYVTHDKSEAFQRLSIDSMNYRQDKDLYKRLNNEQTIKTSLNFGKSPEELKADYLDVSNGVYVEVINTDRFDEETDLSTAYLGKVDMKKAFP